MSAIAFQITSLTIVYSTVYSDADQIKHQSSASLAFVWGIHRDRWIPAQIANNAEMSPFDDVVMLLEAGWRIFNESANWVSIVWGNGLSPTRRLVITWTWFIGSLTHKNILQWKLMENKIICIQENAFIWKRCWQNGGHFVSAAMCWVVIRYVKWHHRNAMYEQNYTWFTFVPFK